MTMSFRFLLSVLVFGIVFSMGKAEGQSPRQKLLRSPDANRPGMHYWIYLPDRNAEAKRPLLLFLHGGGEGGGDPELVKKHGPPKLIEQGKDFPAIVVSPQNPSKLQHWDDQQLNELLDHLVRTLPVDEDRIYLTGLSRGCFGGWRLLIQSPDRFAAFVGICGGGLAPYAKRVAHIPIRLFHGEDDSVIPLEESRRMRDAHRAAGGDCELKVYPGTNHNSWDQAYSEVDLYDWIFRQRRKQR